MIVDHRQDLKKEMIVEVHSVKKEMIKEVLLETEEMIVDHRQDLKKEMIVEALTVRRAVNRLGSKRNLQVLRKNLIRNLLSNPQFNLNNYFSKI